MLSARRGSVLLVLDPACMHLTQTRNSNLGFALAFLQFDCLDRLRFETFGDNQFATPITCSDPAQSGQIPDALRPEPGYGDHSLKFA